MFTKLMSSSAAPVDHFFNSPASSWGTSCRLTSNWRRKLRLEACATAQRCVENHVELGRSSGWSRSRSSSRPSPNALSGDQRNSWL